MSQVLRWTIGVVAAVVIVGLVAYGRGAEHHRGSQVGAKAQSALVAARPQF